MREKSATARVASRISLSSRSRFSRSGLCPSDVDRHLVEERIDMRAQLRHRASWRRRNPRARRRRRPPPWRRRSRSPAPIPRPGGRATGRARRHSSRASFFSSMRRMLAARLVPASRFLPSSVSRNLPERLDAADDQQEIVLAFEREHGIDEIVPRALLAQLDLQAVGEEGEEIEIMLERSSRAWTRSRPASIPKPNRRIASIACQTTPCRNESRRCKRRLFSSNQIRITPSAARRSA